MHLSADLQVALRCRKETLSMTQFENLPRRELEKKLAELKELLEEVLEEREIILGKGTYIFQASL
jgi:hypothetical protein